MRAAMSSRRLFLRVRLQRYLPTRPLLHGHRPAQETGPKAPAASDRASDLYLPAGVAVNRHDRWDITLPVYLFKCDRVWSRMIASTARASRQSTLRIAHWSSCQLGHASDVLPTFYAGLRYTPLTSL